ncbi:hypothetical protein BV898_07028 [Hypsibius exemplaris]|uniref:Uncharacterized protein n=1 Tax=Hypsibius exemplaris TaxID=2072580 RepID=A0A1W0WV01_HYPEX|nr:hypothetical protein BV898_07028 [Hypsibius exemplaris]
MAVSQRVRPRFGASPRNAAPAAERRLERLEMPLRGARKTGASSAGSRTTRSGCRAGGGSGGMWRFYSEGFSRHQSWFGAGFW